MRDDYIESDMVKLCRDGAMWMLMNIENGYPHDDGLLKAMHDFNREELDRRLNVEAYYNYCCQFYLTEGKQAFIERSRGVPLRRERKLF